MKTTFVYLFDQANPYQTSARAHHGVDLIYLFGGSRLVEAANKTVSDEMQRRWIMFINGEAPWDGAKLFAFGPLGRCGLIPDEELEVRRRKQHIEMLKVMDNATLEEVSRKLSIATVSLEN